MMIIAKTKKCSILFFVVALAALFTGCSGGTKASDKDVSSDINIRSDILKDIEDGLSTNVIDLLYDGIDGFTVSSINGKVYVTARVGVDFYIPLVAQELCPIVVSGVSENNCDVDIVIQKYGTGNNTSVSWHTTDGEKGTFLDTTQNVTKPNATIDDMREYYSDQISEWENILLDTSEQ